MDRLSTKGQMIDQVDLRNVPHSGFDRSNHNYGTGKLGKIIPVRLDEVFPGDRIKGKSEIVANFEPLAAPLMGSMVLKQESFFVPLIQLWRNSYKFFTGKNGFNEDMPSVSPSRILNIYKNVFYNSLFGTIGSEELDEFDTSFNGLFFRLSKFYNGTSLSYNDRFGINFYDDYRRAIDSYIEDMHNEFDDRKMFDLIQPTIDILERTFESKDLLAFHFMLEDGSISDRRHNILQGIGFLSAPFRDIFNYLQGPSSLFDYLGWPVPIDLKVKNKQTGDVQIIDDYGVYDYFGYTIFRNMTHWGSYNLFSSDQYYTTLLDIFSTVPLVFNPFKAYYLVWYWNYRDQLLETDILDPEEDEFLSSIISDNVIVYCTIMRQRCWYKDTFTTALTNTGDGNLIVPMLAEGEKSYTFYDAEGALINTSDVESAYTAGATSCKVNTGDYEYTIPMNYLQGAMREDSAVMSPVRGFLSLDLFDRIKRLRSVVQKRLILGYEVDDVVYSSFMVRMSNVRLHIPELLGRGRDSVVINTIVNNTSTDQQIAGDKTATAFAHGQQSEMDYFSEDWGIFLTFMTIMPIQSYAGGMQRLYLKKNPLDYMWPEYATMGMDAVYNTELAAIGTRLTDEQGLQVFGYQGRYYDLKSRLDEEHGRLLTDLNYLTFSREWDSKNPPKLNYIFVHCWPRLDGFVLESPDLDVFRYDCYNAHGWERRLPVPSEYVGY